MYKGHAEIFTLFRGKCEHTLFGSSICEPTMLSNMLKSIEISQSCFEVKNVMLIKNEHVSRYVISIRDMFS